MDKGIAESKQNGIMVSSARLWTTNPAWWSSITPLEF
jgi:hypothetical protein